MSKMVECLNFLCDCSELTSEEKAQFLKKVGGGGPNQEPARPPTRGDEAADKRDGHLPPALQTSISIIVLLPSWWHGAVVGGGGGSRQARRSLGCTALMLSGGGAIAMYHVGVLRTLIEEGLYK